MELFLPLFIAQCFLLYLGQRAIFPRVAAISWPLALFLAAPGTALHEASHWLACKLLGVPTGRVELFRPRRQENGGVQLGVVEHGRGGPIEMTLVAIAPLLLLPPLLLGILVALLGTDLLSQPDQAFLGAGPIRQILALYLLFSAGWAAFPSPGDHIPISGAVLLGFLLAALVFLLGLERTEAALEIIVLVLLPASASALLQLLVVLLFSRRRRAAPDHEAS